jgi:hypothetical protein
MPTISTRDIGRLIRSPDCGCAGSWLAVRWYAHLGLGMLFCRGFFLRNPGGVLRNAAPDFASAHPGYDAAVRISHASGSARSRQPQQAGANKCCERFDLGCKLVCSGLVHVEICPMPCTPGLNLIRNPLPAGIVLCSIQRYSAFTIGRSQMVSGGMMNPLIRQVVSVLPQTLRSSRPDRTFPRADQSRQRPSRG